MDRSSDTFVCNKLLVTIKHILADVVTISWNDVLADEQSKKGKVFPYSLPSVGPGADPGVQAVSPQVT